FRFAIGLNLRGRLTEKQFCNYFLYLVDNFALNGYSSSRNRITYILMSSDEVRNQIKELESLHLQTRRFRLCTVLAVVAIAVVGVSTVISSFLNLTTAGPEQDLFVKELGGNLQTN